MSDTALSFIDMAVDGTAALGTIDDHVDRWHQTAPTQSLQSFLGMTEAEYILWLRHPDTLADIVRARRERLAPKPATSETVD